jgi:Xaa-Pro dipeptidase
VTSVPTPTSELRDRRELVRDNFADWGVDAYLVTNPSDLLYLTGFDGISPLGSNPFTGGPSAALLATRESIVVCLPESDAGLVSDDPDVQVQTYPTFLQLSPLYPRVLFREALLKIVRVSAPRPAILGYQAESLPASIREELDDEGHGVRLSELGHGVGVVRMRKSEFEIASLRRSISVCDAAQAVVRKQAVAGATEKEILQAIKSTVSDLAGSDVPLIHEVTSGPRSGRIGFSASERELSTGDLLLTDIAPRIDGYWGDSCATGAIGATSGERASMVRTVQEALAIGTKAVCPGVATSEVDRLMRDYVGLSFPAYHNSGGHGIGLDYHEPPRLVPSETIRLQPGMVIAMEPGIYLPDVAGVRLEHVVLVTSDGCEVLSSHLDGMPQTTG